MEESLNIEDYLDDEDFEESKIPKYQSAIGGALQGVSANLADEIAGAGRAALDPATVKRIGLMKAYQQYRDESREMFKAEQEANPASYLTGEIGGGLATIPVTGATMTVPKAAAIGALYGFGGAEGEPLEQAKSTITSGVLGGGIQKGLQAINPTKIGQSLKSFAEERAVKATDPMKRDIQGLFNTNQLNKTGRDLLDEKVVTPLASNQDMLSRAIGLEQREAPKISQSLKDIDLTFDKVSKLPGSNINLEKLKISSPVVVRDLVNKFLIPLHEDPVLRDTLAPKVSNIIANIKNDFGTSNITLTQAEKLKRQFQNLTNYDATRPKEEQKFYAGIANYFKNLVEDAAERKTGAMADIAEKQAPEFVVPIENLSKQFLKSKGITGSMNSAIKNLEGGEVKNLSNRYISPSDYMMGAGAGIAGASLGSGSAATAGLSAAGGALTNKFLRKYGNQLSAVGADKLGNILSNQPEKLGKFARILSAASHKGGPRLMQITSSILVKNNPDYAEKLYSAISEKKQEDEQESENIEDYLE